MTDLSTTHSFANGARLRRSITTGHAACLEVKDEHSTSRQMIPLVDTELAVLLGAAPWVLKNLTHEHVNLLHDTAAIIGVECARSTLNALLHTPLHTRNPSKQLLQLRATRQGLLPMAQTVECPVNAVFEAEDDGYRLFVCVKQSSPAKAMLLICEDDSWDGRVITELARLDWPLQTTELDNEEEQTWLEMLSCDGVLIETLILAAHSENPDDAVTAVAHVRVELASRYHRDI